MPRYHINPETQRPNICTATGARGCKYAVNGEDPEHYSSKEDANTAIAARAAAENDAFTTVSKGVTVSATPELTRWAKRFPSKIKGMNESEAALNVVAMNREYNAMVKAEGEEAENVLRGYAMTDSMDINGYLRYGDRAYYYRNDPYKGTPREEEMTDLARRGVAALDDIMGKYGQGNAKEPRLLYRYIKVPKGESVKSFSEKLISTGKLRDEGYMSTTEDPAFIHSTLSHKTGGPFIVLEILSNRGISMQSKEEQRKGDVQSFEQERLLPRNSSFIAVASKGRVFSTGEDRIAMLKHFAPYNPDPNHVPTPPPDKRIYCIQLVDEALFEENLAEGVDSSDIV